MKSIMFFVLIAFFSGFVLKANAQAKIDVKTSSITVGGEVKGNIELNIIGGRKPYDIVLYEFHPPSATKITESKGSNLSHFTFNDLAPNHYFIHVKDASGKLTISNPIKINRKFGKGGKPAIKEKI